MEHKKSRLSETHYHTVIYKCTAYKLKDKRVDHITSDGKWREVLICTYTRVRVTQRVRVKMIGKVKI